MATDDRNRILQLLAHVQNMAHQSKQVAMDGGNWRKLLDELGEAARLCIPINNALREAETHVYLVSNSPLPDDVAAYSNEEGAEQNRWDLKTLGADATVTKLPLFSAPLVTMTTVRE